MHTVLNLACTNNPKLKGKHTIQTKAIHLLRPKQKLLAYNCLMDEESIETSGFLKCLHMLKNGFPFFKRIKKKKKNALFISFSPKKSFFDPKIQFKLDFSAFKFKKFQFHP